MQSRGSYSYSVHVNENRRVTVEHSDDGAEAGTDTGRSGAGADGS